MAQSGIYVGNGDDVNPVAKLVSDYEQWLGTPVNIIALHTGAAGWNDWIGSIGWQIWNHRDVITTHDIHWSIPLIPNWDSSMWSAAQGSYDSKYIEAAKTIADGTPGTDPIVIRTGWEFNATWSPHSSSAMGQPDNYVGAFHHFVDSFRSVSDRFVFEWTPNIGDQGMDPSLAYPGDSYVDIIGMDFYWDSKQPWSITDPVQAWDSFVNQPYGLQWLEDFATAHGKPSAYSEWGINSDNAGYFIEQAAKWFESHNVLFQSYWEANYAFAGELHNGQYANAANAFLNMFGAHIIEIPETPAEIQTMAIWQTWKKGTSLSEIIVGSDKNDSINGGGGMDIISGGKGDDRYTYYGTETFVEKAGEGIDSMGSWAKGLTILQDNIEYLYIQANFAQEGQGNILANAIIGGTANNIINGKEGNDWLTGGGGLNIFVHQKGGGHDVITDFHAGKGMDTLRLSGHDFSNFQSIQDKLYQHGQDVVLLIGNGDVVTFLNTQKSSFSQSDFMTDQYYGTDANDTYSITTGTEVVYEGTNGGTDTIQSWVSSYTMGENIENIVLLYGLYLTQNAKGNVLDNIMTGGDANNTMRADAGNDVLIGNDGNDILYGDSGSDILRGGAGTDYLYGGLGADTFAFDKTNTGTGVDRIKDFNISQGDRIDISNVLQGLDPIANIITNYINVMESGKNSVLRVDLSGSGTNWTDIAIIENVLNMTDESMLVQKGHLVI